MTTFLTSGCSSGENSNRSSSLSTRQQETASGTETSGSTIADNSGATTAGSSDKTTETSGSGTISGSATGTVDNEPAQPAGTIVPGNIKPDESGKVIVLMFHNFISEYKTGGDKEWTTTYDKFRKLLQDLYDRGYRLISLLDYLKGNIDVPEGKMPIVFTFDDGTAGQFNLVEENGSLMANKNSAVGVMEEFAASHPDFGLKGTFYVYFGGSVFSGSGTIAQRLKYLIGEGFEIGNHTYSHINFATVKTAEQVQKELGENNNKMLELIPGYSMDTMALPFGETTKSLASYLVKGIYNNIVYNNLAVLKVGWDPNLSPFMIKFNPQDIHRVRNSGLKPVDGDLDWWLARLTPADLYVSDGDPATVTVPKSKQGLISKGRLNGRKLLVY